MLKFKVSVSFLFRKKKSKIILWKTPLVPKNYDLMIPSGEFLPWQQIETPGDACLLSSWVYLEGHNWVISQKMGCTRGQHSLCMKLSRLHQGHRTDSPARARGPPKGCFFFWDCWAVCSMCVCVCVGEGHENVNLLLVYFTVSTQSIMGIMIRQ